MTGQSHRPASPGRRDPNEDERPASLAGALRAVGLRLTPAPRIWLPRGSPPPGQWSAGHAQMHEAPARNLLPGGASRSRGRRRLTDWPAPAPGGLVHYGIATSQQLLNRRGTAPVAGEPHSAALVPHRDGDRVARSRLSLVGHGHLEGGVAVDRDDVERIGDVLDA